MDVFHPHCQRWMWKKQKEGMPHTLCQNLRDRFRKREKGGKGSPNLAISGPTSENWNSKFWFLFVCFFVVEYLFKMFHFNFSLGDYLEATLRTEIYRWIAWGTNSLYHLLQLPIYFWGQSGCSLVIELKQRGTSFVPTQWPGSVSEWMLHGNVPFLFTSTGIWDRIVAPTSFH